MRCEKGLLQRNSRTAELAVNGFLYQFKVHAFKNGIDFKQGGGFLGAGMRVFIVIVVYYHTVGVNKEGGFSFQSFEMHLQRTTGLPSLINKLMPKSLCVLPQFVIMHRSLLKHSWPFP